MNTFFCYSVLCIEDGLTQISLQKEHDVDPTKVVSINIPGAMCNDSSPDLPQPTYAMKQGWMDSVFGCLRPVLSIIGKNNANEIKGNQGNSQIN